VFSDPNMSNVLFYAFAAAFAAVTGILFVASQRARTSAVRVRNFVRNPKNKENSTYNRQAE
jgi:hypothetical protein